VNGHVRKSGPKSQTGHFEWRTGAKAWTNGRARRGAATSPRWDEALNPGSLCGGDATHMPQAISFSRIRKKIKKEYRISKKEFRMMKYSASLQNWKGLMVRVMRTENQRSGLRSLFSFEILRFVI
jgi:hypothetical protein